MEEFLNQRKMIQQLLIFSLRLSLSTCDSLILIGKASFEDFSLDELFVLSQQHCFAGYSLPELQACVNAPRVFTRHHMIDWNFHPLFPRSRPNRWFVQYYPDPSGNGIDSFKEFSTVRDSDAVPIYFERWQRLAPTPNQKTKYLVLRKSLPCPMKLARENRLPTEHEQRDAILIVIGNHFAFVQDRSYQMLSKFVEEKGEALRREGKGGGGAFIKYLLSLSNSSENSNSDTNYLRDIMVEYLDLEGSYGQLIPQSGFFRWTVNRSTFPWTETMSLFHPYDSLMPLFQTDKFVALEWTLNQAGGERDINVRSRRARGSWEVMECSFTMSEVYQLFGAHTKHPHSKL